MLSKFIQFVFIVFFLTIQQNCSPKVAPVYALAWDKNKPIAWNNFAANHPPSRFDAEIYWQIFFEKQGEHWVVFAAMDETKSWQNDISRAVLRHEQYHFNIAEVCAREIRKAAIEQKLKPATKDFFDMFTSKLNVCNLTQKMYDDETDHSKNKEQQKLWQQKIDAQLKQLSTFENIIID